MWLRWVAWMNPAIYVYNSIISNEMSEQIFPCVASQYVSFGPGYDSHSEYRACSTVGSDWNSTINREAFISRMYWASSRYMWTNVLILAAFWIGFAIMTAIGYELRLQQDSGSEVLFNRNLNSTTRGCTRDSIRQNMGTNTETSSNLSTAAKLKQATFTFKDISYCVQRGSEELQLL